MTDNTTTQLWSLLSESFGTILRLLEPNIPGVSMTAGHSRNEAFPSHAYADYFSAGRYVVISFDIHSEGDGVTVAADIAEDTGIVIKDFTEAAIAEIPEAEQLIVRRAEEFASQCKQDAGLIADELRRIASATGM